MSWKRDLLALFLLLILSVFAVLPLFHAGYFTMHDDQHIVRLFEFDKALLAGQFPVRWIAGLGFGFGYALFNFYPPLIYYVGEFFHLIGFSLIDSVKAVWFLAIVGSGFAMYFLAKNFFGRIGALVAALFYMYAPYHAVDAYVRGALAELASFVWLPLILLFAKKAAETGKLKYSLWTGIFLGLLMLTHNLIFLPFFGLSVLWFGAMVLIYKTKLKTAIGLFLLSTVLCFGLTAFFWLPSLWEKQFTLVDSLLIKNLASYNIHFVCPSQLWDSLWGFGGSIPGCVDGLSFKIGKLHILVSIAAAFVAIYLWIKNQRKLSLVVLTGLMLLSFSIFMTTNYSKFIWDNISLLWYLQFPWRFLEFVTLFSSFLVASLFIVLPNKYAKAGLGAFLIALLFFVNLKLFVPQQYLEDATDKKLTTNEEIKWRVSGTSFEYMPKGVATKLTDKGAVWVDIEKEQIPNLPYKTTLSTTSQKFTPSSFTFITDNLNAGTVQIQTTNFPGWKVWIDGKEVKITDNNKYKLITISVPAGNHEVVGKFENTNVRTLGDSITLITLFALIIFTVFNLWKLKKQ